MVVDGDPKRLAQALGAIIRNALAVTAESDNIWVEVDAAATEVAVRVRHSGGGISSELPHVFDFVALRNHSPHNIGMDLDVARKIVTLHGGGLDAASSGEERGSEFVMRLPRVK